MKLKGQEIIRNQEMYDKNNNTSTCQKGVNIVIIQRDIDPSPYLKKIYNRWNDWDWVAQQSNIGGDKDPYGFLPLVWAKGEGR